MQILLDWLDDKTQVIIVLFVLAMTMMFLIPDAAIEYMDAIIGALAGLVVGEKLAKNNK